MILIDNSPRSLDCSYLQKFIKFYYFVEKHTHVFLHKIMTFTMTLYHGNPNTSNDWKSVALGFETRTCRHCKTQAQHAQWGPYASTFKSKIEVKLCHTKITCITVRLNHVHARKYRHHYGFDVNTFRPMWRVTLIKAQKRISNLTSYNFYMILYLDSKI